MERIMKVIRVTMLAMALCAVATSASAAQQQPETATQGGRAAGMGGMILQGISLSDAQKAQHRAIREKYAPQLMKVRKTAETTGTPIDQVKLAEIRAAQTSELRAILTSEQQATFDTNVAVRRGGQE